MENPKDPKNEKTSMSQVFTIDENQWDNQMPGVTKLTLRGQLPKKKSETTPAVSIPKKIPTAPQTSTDSKLNLEKFNVLFELQFEMKNSNYFFHQIKSYQGMKVASWQNTLFEGMKLDLNSLGILAEFQEFTFKQNHFIFEVFGVNPSYFIQIIKLKSKTQRIFALISKVSLLPTQNTVMAEIQKAS